MDQVNEEWRDIPSYEGFYQVSSLGRVRSTSRSVITKFNVVKNYKGKIISTHITINGYVSFKFWKNGKAVYASVHRSVAEAFIPNDSNKSQVNHINGNKQDNRPANLEWATPKENTAHSISVLGNSRKRIFTKDQIWEILSFTNQKKLLHYRKEKSISASISSHIRNRLSYIDWYDEYVAKNGRPYIS